MAICLMTNDVETTSIINGGLRVETGEVVAREGMPALLDLYAKYDVKATFFYIARYAKRCPEIVKMAYDAGHEVAVHGLTHDHKMAYDTMSLEQQIDHLSQAKAILEDIIGDEVVSFRSPALRVNEFTPLALIETGFKFDSSVAPQRMDMFMSLGSRKKLTWLKAPRDPYYVSENNLARRGNTNLIEVPVSSFGLPYIGTFMRISPSLTHLVRRLLLMETCDTTRPINFLIHPNELILEEDLHLETERRASNYLSYLLSDVLRHKLKLKNLGSKAIDLFEDEIKFWKEHEYQFKRVKDIVVK